MVGGGPVNVLVGTHPCTAYLEAAPQDRYRIKHPLGAAGRVLRVALAAILWSTLTGAHQPTHGQGFTNFTKEHGRMALTDIKKDLKKHYYDTTFGGIDLEAHFDSARNRIDAATSTGQILGIIAETVLAFDDSHTRFDPPIRTVRIEYGWQMQMIGDTCHVVAVRPGSDAEAKGLETGDMVLSVGGWEVTRDNLWKIKYGYYTVRPQPGMRLVVKSKDGRQLQLDVMAKITELQRVYDLERDRWKIIRELENESRLRRDSLYQLADSVIIWKMPQWYMSNRDIGRTMDRVRENGALILDLRGNPGGSVSMLQRLTGYFFDHDLTIAELASRKEKKPLKAKTRGKDVFNGKLIVLVDSESGSASEVFARVIQLEGRGTVIGDRTAGAVMQSRFYDHQIGQRRVIYYAVSVTEADVIMSDGKSLERVGVTPNEILLPTMEDLADGLDPVLTRAAALLGVDIDPAEAGALSPIEWRN
jgi:C-terminal processing protease CtpA/Prc